MAALLFYRICFNNRTKVFRCRWTTDNDTDFSLPGWLETYKCEVCFCTLNIFLLQDIFLFGIKMTDFWTFYSISAPVEIIQYVVFIAVQGDEVRDLTGDVKEALSADFCTGIAKRGSGHSTEPFVLFKLLCLVVMMLYLFINSFEI